MVKTHTLAQCFKIFKLRDIIGFAKLFITFIPGKIMKLLNRDIWVVTELKENLDLIKTTADKITSDLERELSKKVDKEESLEAVAVEETQAKRKKVR